MTGPRVGYALCLQHDPDDARTERARLVDLGCATVHIDHGVTAHAGRGAKPASWPPGFAAALVDCRPDGVLVVTDLARLAPRFRELQATVAALAHAGVELDVAGDVVDWSTNAGHAYLATIEQLVAFETTIKRRRSLEGRANATPGRPTARSLQEQQRMRTLRAAGTSPAELAKIFNVSPRTVHRYTRGTP